MEREKDGPGTFRVVLGPHKEEKRELAHRFHREMTPSEARLWQQLRGNRLGGLHFRRQQVIEGFIADFYCHAAGLVVEVDGAVHEKRKEYDAERDEVLQRRSLDVLRFTNAEIDTDLRSVLAKILLTARERIQPAK